nr:MAG: replication-associated protein [Giant panda Genomoviridae]
MMFDRRGIVGPTAVYICGQVCPVSWAIILVSPRTLWTQLCQAFFAMHDTFSSLTHNAATCPSGPCWTSFHHWELSASLDESSTRISAFISTCSQISDGSFEVEKLIFSMWTVGTQTSNALGELQRKVTTMRSRMETLSRVVSSDQTASMGAVRLLTCGLRLRARRIEASFGVFARNWIPRVCAAHSGSCRNSPTGDSPRSLPSMSHPEELTLFREMLMVEVHGWKQLVLDWETHQ